MTAPYPPQPPPPPQPGPQQNNTLGLVAMILGIVSIPMVCCFWLGVPMGIAAAILGFLGKQKADQGLATNRSQALAGIFCGAGAIAFAILLTIIVFVFNWGTFGYYNY